jgi:hypothetical protein
MTVPHHNRVGSILRFEKPKATRCNSGDQILPYMLRLIFGKKFYGPPLCVFLFDFLKLQRKRPDTWSIPLHITPEPPKMIFGLKKLIKGPKMVTKRGQKLYK